MINRLRFLLTLAITLASLAGHSAVLTVRFDKTDFAPNQPVTATVTAAGAVGIENEIRAQSYQETVNGTRTVNLGQPAKPGFYRIRFFAGTEVRDVVLPVFGELPAFTPSVQPLTAPQAALVERLYKGFTKDRWKRTWDGWDGKQYIAEKAVAIATVGPFGLACAVGATPACSVALPAAVDLAADVTAKLLLEFVKVLEKDGLISMSERTTLDTLIRAGKVFAGVLSSDTLRERAVTFVTESASEVFDAVVSNPSAKVSVTVFQDQAKKTYLILKKLKP
ncbi:MAG: hypothetical protein AB7O66_10660 [Limisphaerales bacterium]